MRGIHHGSPIPPAPSSHRPRRGTLGHRADHCQETTGGPFEGNRAEGAAAPDPPPPRMKAKQKPCWDPKPLRQKFNVERAASSRGFLNTPPPTQTPLLPRTKPSPPTRDRYPLILDSSHWPHQIYWHMNTCQGTPRNPTQAALFPITISNNTLLAFMLRRPPPSPPHRNDRGGGRIEEFQRPTPTPAITLFGTADLAHTHRHTHTACELHPSRRARKKQVPSSQPSQVSSYIFSGGRKDSG